MKNKKLDYSKLNEIIVHTQKELDNIPLDYKGQIIIDDTNEMWLEVKHNYYNYVIARNSAMVDAYDSARVDAYDSARVYARNSARVYAYDSARVDAYDSAMVDARNSARVYAYDSARVDARNSARVDAYDSARVDAYDSASVDARNSARVDAYGNVQVLNNLENYRTDTIKLKGNSRIIYLSKCIEDFMNYHGIEHTKTKAIFYKAVHKIGDRYVSDWDRDFEYKIGQTISQVCNQDVEEDCGEGIHISTLPFALYFGCDWDDIAILECETKIEDIVLPNETTDKVRTSKVKVIREVPLNECGVRGEMLAKDIEFRTKK